MEVISQNLDEKNKNQLVIALFASMINSKNPKVPIEANNKSLQNKVLTLKDLAVSYYITEDRLQSKTPNFQLARNLPRVVRYSN